jgi:uncharacterized protein
VLVADQTEVITFLSRPDSYPGAMDSVDRVETHVSEIFLVGDLAYKLKRAVRFPYLNFSTAELRRAACEAEMTVNRRTAPALYRDVVSVNRRADGNLVLGGAGDAVDWLLVMNRFDEATLFDRMAAEGALDEGLMTETASVIAGFHEKAERRSDYGGAAGIAGIVEGNAACFAEPAADFLDAMKISRLDDLTRRGLAARTDVLDTRRDDGLVRHCHGDLHLRNIFLDDGKPTLFDGIEFSQDLANIDVLYDLAFLLMDLDHRDLRLLASIVLNRYLDLTGDVDGLFLLPLFLAMRAAVRSHVGAAAAATLEDAAGAERGRSEARQYLDLAISYLHPSTPCLVAIGGLSGSGKSRLSRAVAPGLGAAPGARIVRTDVVRKRLAGVDSTTRLPDDAYGREMTEQVYRCVGDEVRRTLAAGHTAIADAVFADPGERSAIASVARDAGVPFVGLWLEASSDTMAARIAGRRGDASDATTEVLRRQLGYDLGDIAWRRIDSGGGRKDTERLVLAAIDNEARCWQTRL